MSKHSGCSNASGASGNTPGGLTMGGNATSPVRHNHLTYQHGHSFIKKTFHKPTNCHYCGDLLWGLMGQGYICEGEPRRKMWLMSCLSLPYFMLFPVCNIIVHEKCLKTVALPCVSIAATLVKVNLTMNAG